MWVSEVEGSCSSILERPMPAFDYITEQNKKNQTLYSERQSAIQFLWTFCCWKCEMKMQRPQIRPIFKKNVDIVLDSPWHLRQAYLQRIVAIQNATSKLHRSGVEGSIIVGPLVIGRLSISRKLVRSPMHTNSSRRPSEDHHDSLSTSIIYIRLSKS